MLCLQKGTKLRIADFVHGADGLGNQNFPPPNGKPIEESAASFLVNQAKANPGKITVVALGPLTNIALVCYVRNVQFLIFVFSLHTLFHAKVILGRLYRWTQNSLRTLDRSFCLVDLLQ